MLEQSEKAEARLPEDAREVMRRIRAAVAVSGLTQAAFAKAVGTSSSRLSTYIRGRICPSAHFLVRAERLGAAVGAAGDRGLLSAPAAALTIRAHRHADGAETEALRVIERARRDLSTIIDEGDRVLLAAWEAAPVDTGSPRWDVLLAAVAAHQLEGASLPTPAWTRKEPLAEPWVVTPTGGCRFESPTADWLRAWNIHTLVHEPVA